MELKYLFTAIYNDGTSFRQPPDDKSSIDSSKSSWFDVRVADVNKFYLTGGKMYSVDLRTGEFSVNGVKFNIGDSHLAEGAKRQLIYYREHTHSFNSKLEEFEHKVEYVLGWKIEGGPSITIRFD